MECPIKKNEHYEMDIIDIGNDGEGIGKIDNFTVFVNNAVPQEKIDVVITKVKKNFAYGKLIDIKKRAQYRAEPFCAVYKYCGGCNLQHIKYSQQLKFKTKKVQDTLERIGGFKNIKVSETIGAQNYYNYRNKAQFPVVAGKNNTVDIGFYAKRSHNVINIESCLIQNKINDDIIKIIRNFIAEENIPPYDENTNTGVIRHIVTRIGVCTGEILVCIVINQKLKSKEKLVNKIKTIKGVKGIVLSINTKKTNVILGNKINTLWGQDYITDYIGDVKFKISINSFYQVNPSQTKILYNKVLEFAKLTGIENVIDIYCGIGTISLFLAKMAKKVVGVEIVEQAIFDAKENAKINGITNAEFISGCAETVIPNLYKNGFTADVVVVDPPRKGCDYSVIDTILNMRPNKIIYVSCDVSTLARDLKIICQNDYKIEIVQPVDQFCHTTHVETVVLITKNEH